MQANRNFNSIKTRNHILFHKHIKEKYKTILSLSQPAHCVLQLQIITSLATHRIKCYTMGLFGYKS